jgi:hypothetical protein
VSIRSSCAASRSSSSRAIAALGDELLEAVQVDLVRAELQRVAGPLRHDRLAAFPERLPELRDADLQRGQPRLRLLVAPQLFEQAAARDRLVGVQEEDRQQRALLRAVDRHGPSTVDDLERPQHPEFHRPPPVSAALVRG